MSAIRNRYCNIVANSNRQEQQQQINNKHFAHLSFDTQNWRSQQRRFLIWFAA
jgi:hypothetical protein